MPANISTDFPGRMVYGKDICDRDNTGSTCIKGLPIQGFEDLYSVNGVDTQDRYN